MRRIIVAGAIAVGKSTITSMLVDGLPGAVLVPELLDQHDFLEPFYSDRARWAFHSRVEFLALKADQWLDPVVEGSTLVFDRSLHELVTFARVLCDDGALSATEFNLYERIYSALCAAVPSPDALLWLSAPADVCLDRIKLRGRSFEQGIDRLYLEALHRQYQIWFDAWTSCPKVALDTSEVLDAAATCQWISNL